MKVFCLYRPNTEHERPVMELNRELQRRYKITLDLYSVDTIEGASKAKLYDVMQYPAVVATDNSGVIQKIWDGGQLPLINELTYYLQ